MMMPKKATMPLMIAVSMLPMPLMMAMMTEPMVRKMASKQDTTAPMMNVLCVFMWWFFGSSMCVLILFLCQDQRQ